jgi:hypothetical protein
MDTLKVGSNTDAWCTKCKLVLAHTIEAIAGGTLKRVQCNTCRGKHQYKANAPGTKAEKKPTLGLKSKNLTPKSKSKASDFTRLLSGKDPSSAPSYSVSRHFVRGDVMNHATFGVGVVVEEKDVSKIEVLFATGAKILVHART